MRKVICLISLILVLALPTSAYALNGSLGGTTGISGGTGSGSSGQNIASFLFKADKTAMRRWVFGSNAEPTTKNYGNYYDVKSVGGKMSPKTMRGSAGVFDHWNLYIVSPTINDPQGNGVDDNTTQALANAVKIEAWEPPTTLAKYNGEPWEQYWHNHYWSAASGTKGTPRPAKTDYPLAGKDGTLKAADPHVHQWYDSKHSQSKPIRGSEWKHDLDNYGNPLTGGAMITVQGANGSAKNPPKIAVDTGALALDLTRPEGRYVLWMFGIDGRGSVQNRAVNTEVVRRPRVKVIGYVDANSDGNYDAGEQTTLTWSVTLKSGVLQANTITSPLKNSGDIVGQDAHGNAVLDSNKKVIGRDVLPPAVVMGKPVRSTPSTVKLLDGSTQSVLTQHVTQRGYYLDVSVPSGYDVAGANVLKDYWVGGTQKQQAANILGQMVKTGADDYRWVGKSKSSTAYYTLTDPSKNVGAGIPFGYANNEFDGGTYTIYVQLRSQTTPVIGKVYWDKNENNVRDAGEPLLPNEVVNTLKLNGTSPRLVGSKFTLSNLAVGNYNLTMELGIGSLNIPWTLEAPVTKKVAVTQGGAPIEVLWGATYTFTPTPKPTFELETPEAWMDTGRPYTVHLSPKRATGGLDVWQATQTFLYTPPNSTYWDWCYARPTLTKMPYKEVAGATSVDSEPQAMQVANAIHGIQAPTQVWLDSQTSFPTVSAALNAKPELHYADGSTVGTHKGGNTVKKPLEVTLTGGLNYYGLVLWQHEDLSLDIQTVNGEVFLNPTATTNYEWGYDAQDTKVYTAKPRY